MWDTQSASKDRLIGSCEVTYTALRSGISQQRLKPPHWINGRQDMVDMLTCCAGLGPSGRPGELTLKLEEGPEMDHSMHKFVAFVRRARLNALRLLCPPL